ncbi:hypothetical protein HUU62_27010 [Rhodoferax sp. 4810]|nr:hypothetical protein [Rhodoferax jenense]
MLASPLPVFNGLLQGLNKLVDDLSGGCTVHDIVNRLTITAIQAQQSKEKNHMTGNHYMYSQNLLTHLNMLKIYSIFH